MTPTSRKRDEVAPLLTKKMAKTWSFFRCRMKDNDVVCLSSLSSLSSSSHSTRGKSLDWKKSGKEAAAVEVRTRRRMRWSRLKKAEDAKEEEEEEEEVGRWLLRLWRYYDSDVDLTITAPIDCRCD